MKFSEEEKAEARKFARESKACILMSDYLYDRHDWMNKPHRFRWVVKHVNDLLLLHDFVLSYRFITEPMDINHKIKIICDALPKFKTRKELLDLKFFAEAKKKLFIAEKNRVGKVLTRFIIDYCDYQIEEIPNSKDFICSRS